MPGWMSVVGWSNYYRFDYKPFKDCRRYESAQRNLLGVCGLLESLRLINRLGIDAIENRILAITDYLCEKLAAHGYRIFSPRSDGEKSGILSFYPRRLRAETVWARLLRRGFVTSARKGLIRISPHFYNNFEEIDRLIHTLTRGRS